MSRKADFFIGLFKALDEQDIRYIVLRQHELDLNRHTFDYDLDLLVRPSDKLRLRSLMKARGLKHRVDLKEENTYFYGAQPHEHFLSKRLDVHIDVVFQLMYRSRNQGEWIPAHRLIQDSIWKNRLCDPAYPGRWRPAPLDEFLDMLAHDILDKKTVKERHQERLHDLSRQVDEAGLNKLLPLLFFKFSPVLVRCARQKQWDNIFEKYNMFKEY